MHFYLTKEASLLYLEDQYRRFVAGSDTRSEGVRLTRLEAYASIASF